MADVPAVTVELSSAPPGAAPVWLDLSSRFRTAGISRGRARELDRYQAGRATLVFSNADRALDPSYAAGPFHAALKPMRRIRLLAVWAAVTYPLFDGYVDSITQEYAPPHEATATIAATDAFKILAAAELRASVYAEEVSADDPYRWWRLDEAGGATVVRDAVAGYVAAPTGDVTLGAETLVTRDPGAAATVNAEGAGLHATEAGVLLRGAPSGTLEAIVRTSLVGTSADEQVVAIQEQSYSGGYESIQLTIGGGTGRVSAGPTGGIVVSPGAVNDGNPHHLAVTWTATTVTLYIDGVSVATGARSGAAPFTDGVAGSFSIGDRGGYFVAAGNQSLIGTVDEVAVYDTALPAGRVAAHAQARATPWAGDTPGARFTRILDAVAFPTGLRDLDAGAVTLQSADLGGTALEHLQKVADSEFGAFYVTADGTVRLEGRHASLNEASAATFGDADDGVELGYTGYVPEYGDELLRNRVTVSRAGGVAQTVTDTASVGEYLVHDWTRDGLLHDSDAVSYDAAAFLVSEYKEPKERVVSLTVAPTGDPARLWPAVLARELTDRVTARRRPQGIGPAIDQLSVVEGIRWTVAAHHWICDLALSPTFAGRFLQLDNPGTTIEGALAARLAF